MGMGGALVLLPSVFAACDSDNDTGTGPSGSTTYTLDLSNDTGILNYAYALEQLEAAYYTAAIASAGFAALSANEQEVLADLQKHEVIHREFFKTVLGSSAIPTINFNTTTVGTLTANRTVLLSTSQLLEDTGVSAYNGAGKYLTSAANLLVAGKIVSVEARHAAAIRDIRDTTGRLFAGDDVVNAAGLDVKAEPGTVGAAVNSLNVINGTIAIGTQPDVNKKTADATAPTPT
ncbi:MAG: ferritin-like domain-containing protein [Gemmatimonadaceae bacterium]